MRIGLDATTRLHGGGGLHLKQILGEWRRLGVYQQHDVVVFARPESLELIREWTGGGVSLTPQTMVSWGSFSRLVWQQLILPVLAWQWKLDVLFCPGNTCPVICRIPTVVMLQNAAPFSPLVTAKSEGMKRWLSFRVLGRMMSLSAKHSKRVIFISEYFRGLFVSAGLVRPERAEVIYLGRELTECQDPDVENVAKLRQLKPLILCISHLYPYKRLGVLITAYQLKREWLTGMGLRLRIVGQAVDDAEYSRLRQMIAEYQLEDWVELCGEVPQNQVSRVLSLALFFVFQTTCENCPSTLIEALAAGVPVASAGVGVMPEIAGDAALYFDPLDPDDLGRALVAMATDDGLRSELVLRARAQILQFPSWERVAINTLACLELAGRQG